MTMPNKNSIESEIEKLANEVESLICDWNRPSQLQDSVEATAMKIAKWHQREVKKGRVAELSYFARGADDLIPRKELLDRLEELEG